jgi:hypothetical protein
MSASPKQPAQRQPPTYADTHTHTHPDTHAHTYTDCNTDSDTYTDTGADRAARAWLQSARPAKGGPLLEWGHLC